MLRIENLTKKYGEKVAVDNLSLTVKAGELCAFIGHNGAGKTTTLKCIAGIIEATDGEIYVDEMSLKEREYDVKRKIAYVPDNPNLYEFMTAIAYLNFIADAYNIGLDERKAQVEKYAKIFEIESVLGNTISTFSHGMKQKLVILSALMHRPKLLILDEPFVGLDPRASHDLKKIMKEFCGEGNSIFFSTHVLEVAEKLCDSFAIIKDGKLIRQGKMSEIKGHKSLEELFLEIPE